MGVGLPLRAIVSNTIKKLEIEYDLLDGQVRSLGVALRSNTSLENIKVRNQNDGNGLAMVLGDVLKTNNTLTRLDLDNNNITDVQSIGEGLKTNNTLKTLNLNNNQLSDNMKWQLMDIEQYKK